MIVIIIIASTTIIIIHIGTPFCRLSRVTYHFFRPSVWSSACTPAPPAPSSTPTSTPVASRNTTLSGCLPTPMRRDCTSTASSCQSHAAAISLPPPTTPHMNQLTPQLHIHILHTIPHHLLHITTKASSNPHLVNTIQT